MGVCFVQVARMKGRAHRVWRWADASRRTAGVILPKERDPRFVTLPRGGTLTDSDHHLLALWAASCAEHVLERFESARPQDPRRGRRSSRSAPGAGGEITMTQARTAGGHAVAAARDLRGRRAMPRTLPARRRSSHTSPHTSSVRPPTRSRPHVLAHRRETVRAQGDSSAGGSATSSRTRFASSYSTTSGYATTSAGRCSTAERASGRQHCPTSPCLAPFDTFADH